MIFVISIFNVTFSQQGRVTKNNFKIKFCIKYMTFSYKVFCIEIHIVNFNMIKSKYLRTFFVGECVAKCLL